MAFKNAQVRPSTDVLTEKRQKLDQYMRKFDSAVKLVTQTVDVLTNVSAEIDETISEIDRYQNELAATKEQLSNEKRKNDRVIQNFQALIATD